MEIEHNMMVLEKQPTLHEHWKVGLTKNLTLFQIEIVVIVAVKDLIEAIRISVMAIRSIGNGV